MSTALLSYKHPITQGGRKCFGDIWIFAKFLIGLHRVLPIPLFKIWTAHKSYYVSKYDNFKSVEVQGWTPLKILIFLHWMCRPIFTTLLGKRSAISHLMAVPKNPGKCKSATISLHRSDSLSASGPPCNNQLSEKLTTGIKILQAQALLELFIKTIFCTFSSITQKPLGLLKF